MDKNIVKRTTKEIYTINWKNGFKYLLMRDDLTKQETNAIVNAANNELWLGGGVAGAIRKIGGNKIQEECLKITNKRGYLKNGEVTHTGIGNFTNKNLNYIFHAVGPYYKGGDKGEKEELYNAFYNCFTLADKNKIKSIAMPPISSGIFGYPKDECAEVFYEALKNYIIEIENESTLKEVRMTIIDFPTYKSFVDVHNKVIDDYKQHFGDEVNFDEQENEKIDTVITETNENKEESYVNITFSQEVADSCLSLTLNEQNDNDLDIAPTNPEQQQMIK